MQHPLRLLVAGACPREGEGSDGAAVPPGPRPHPSPQPRSPSCLKSWVRAGCLPSPELRGVSCPPRRGDGPGLLGFSGEAGGSPKSKRRPWFSLLRLAGEQGRVRGTLQRLSSPVGERGQGSGQACRPNPGTLTACKQEAICNTASLSLGGGFTRQPPPGPAGAAFAPKTGENRRCSCARARAELGPSACPSPARARSQPRTSFQERDPPPPLFRRS